MLKIRGHTVKYDYVVWLKSGSCPEGRADETEIDKLIQAWENPLDSPFCTIEDEDGAITFRIEEICAIAKNTIVEDKVIGY